MKIESVAIGNIKAKEFGFAIRNKLDVAYVLVESLRLFMIGRDYSAVYNEAGKIYLCISKMNRIIVELEDKCFSFSCPFSVSYGDSGIRFYHHSIGDVNSKVLSCVMSIISDERFFSDNPFDFFDAVLEFQEEYQEGSELERLWGVVWEIMSFEDGYVRYDFDEGNANADFHPLHHIDVFYSSDSTFKIGLYEGVKFDKMRIILDSNRKCSYLTIVDN